MAPMLTIVSDSTIDVVTGIPEDQYLKHAVRIHNALDSSALGIAVVRNRGGTDSCPITYDRQPNRTGG